MNHQKIWGYNQNTRLSLKIILVMNSILLIGCGAVIERRMFTTPPTSSAGQACIFQAEQIKNQCLELAQIQATRCEEQASYEEAICESNIWSAHRREPKWYECWRSTCSLNNSHCHDNYVTGYRKCGGTVTFSDVCTSRCEKLTPEQKLMLYGTPKAPEVTPKKVKITKNKPKKVETKKNPEIIPPTTEPASYYDY